MMVPATRWWNRRLPIRYRRGFLIFGYFALLLIQGFMYRNRLLLAEDRGYQLAFLCYSIVMAALFFGASFVSSPDRHMEESDFGKLQIRAGAVMSVLMCGYWLFGDYSNRSLGLDSVIGTVVAGSFVFITTVATTKNPSSDTQVPSKTDRIEGMSPAEKDGAH